MKIPVMLKICGKQSYAGQEPDRIELITDGTLEKTEEGWCVRYEETALTGMEGVTTTFYIRPEEITLERRGTLRSEMKFKKGGSHHSLYQMPFGAIQVTVLATQVAYALSEDGGWVDLVYAIDLDNTASGNVVYRLEISAR